MSRPPVAVDARVRFLGPRLVGQLEGTVVRPGAQEGDWIVRLDRAIYNADYKDHLTELRVNEGSLTVLKGAGEQ